MYRAGLDLGSSFTKGVLVDDQCSVVDTIAVRTGYDFRDASRTVLAHLSRGREIAPPVFTCGYGRDQVDAPHKTHSEIIALAAAISRLYGEEVDVIDIGGQDTKYIWISAAGYVENFRMNRKCAAGTGAFLEEIAFRLGIAPELFDSMARSAGDEVRLNSYCTVFAVSEIIGLIKNGVPMPSIVRGVYRSIVKRCEEMAPPRHPLVFTGGVPDRHPMIAELFAERWPQVRTPELPQFLAAFGCVLLGERDARGREPVPAAASDPAPRCAECRE